MCVCNILNFVHLLHIFSFRKEKNSYLRLENFPFEIFSHNIVGLYSLVLRKTSWIVDAQLMRSLHNLKLPCCAENVIPYASPESPSS